MSNEKEKHEKKKKEMHENFQERMYQRVRILKVVASEELETIVKIGTVLALLMAE